MDAMNAEPIFIEQIAEHFKVDQRTVHSWIRRKRNPLMAWKSGGKLFTTREAINQFVTPVVDRIADGASGSIVTRADIKRRDEALERLRKKFGKS